MNKYITTYGVAVIWKDGRQCAVYFDHHDEAIEYIWSKLAYYRFGLASLTIYIYRDSKTVRVQEISLKEYIPESKPKPILKNTDDKEVMRCSSCRICSRMEDVYKRQLNKYKVWACKECGIRLR